jgi:2-C-methyl-D-erythritol 4-phosphate cytidylyltransferase
MKHKKTGLYISCDFEYNIVLSLDKSKAIHFNIENKYNYINLNFFKSDIRLKFEINNLKYNIKIHKFMLNLYNKTNLSRKSKSYTICILLSAGTSSRFQDTTIHNTTSQYQYKQIHLIENKPIILYSIEKIIDIVDKLIIITNIECYDKIKNIINENYNYQKDKKKKIILLINNINCRLESINTGLHYINKYYSKNNKNLNNIDNIIIHDVARPYITKDYIQKLISSENDNDNTTHLYSQYYLKLTNGLMNLDNNTIVDRNKYIELCTPLCINYNLFNFIFTNYIQKDKSITCEFIPILQLLNININLIEGHYNKCEYNIPSILRLIIAYSNDNYIKSNKYS